ncbi:S-phase kinase-associated protein 2 isoform X1 [Carcharodon carcharias]|uniref:S-phase kinase-associated protein 2 isoform X1 n=2 Tax=Carcharodon carcharias TaxID=13397 RepID=UPI001B7DF489|nr:S-phase kinase-associated protein 2 isoform X1 [Carcharodon carcharias]
MAKETRVLQDVTPSTHSPGGLHHPPTFTWSWDQAETHSLMTVMGVRVIDEKTHEAESLEPAPPQKRPRNCQGKENQPHSFLMPKRFRKSAHSSSGVSCSWEKLPDELLLVIFRSLSLPHLLKASRVSKRWHRLVFDKSLWYSVDLSKGNLPLGTVGQVLGAGVVVLRSPRSFLGDPMFKDESPLCVQYMDLSHCVVSCSAIFQILHRSHRLLSLSLEGLVLSDDVIRAIGQNENLLRLNLCSCSQFGPDSLRQMLSNCSRLDELNLSWCKFSSQHIQAMVSHIPASITQLNISGYRHCLHNSDVETLCRRCPRITNLDMSDNTMLTPSCFSALQTLSHLQHLGLSRCHEIPPTSLENLGEIATLKTLNVYGLVRDSAVNVKELIAQIKVNTLPLTTIGRPTLGNGKVQTIWGIDCRLALHSL